jgi:hypothetical protein
MGGGKGGGSTTTTQQLDPMLKPYVKFALEEGKQQYKDRAGGVPQYGGETIAGFTPDTQGYFGGVRNLTAGVDQLGQAQQMTQDAAGQIAGRPEFTGTQFDPNRLTADQIREYMNPYQQQAIDASTAGIMRRQGEEAANLRARQAQSRALGGSRAAVESEIQNREYRQLAADTESKMLAEGFDRATALAVGQQEAQRKAALDTEQSRQFAEEAGLARGSFGLTAAEQIAGLGQAERDMEVQRLEGLKGIGSMQQALEQAQLDEEYKNFIEQRDRQKQELADYAAIAYGSPAGSQTTSKQPSSLGSTIAGLGMYALGSPWLGTALGFADGGLMDVQRMMMERNRK